MKLFSCRSAMPHEVPLFSESDYAVRSGLLSVLHKKLPDPCGWDTRNIRLHSDRGDNYELMHELKDLVTFMSSDVGAYLLRDAASMKKVCSTHLLRDFDGRRFYGFETHTKKYHFLVACMPHEEQFFVFCYDRKVLISKGIETDNGRI